MVPQLLTLLLVDAAHACFVGLPLVRESMEAADATFVGDVVGVSLANVDDEFEVTLTPVEQWSGDPPEVVLWSVAENGPSCTFPEPVVGNRYLIFVDGAGRALFPLLDTASPVPAELICPLGRGESAEDWHLVDEATFTDHRCRGCVSANAQGVNGAAIWLIGLIASRGSRRPGSSNARDMWRRRNGDGLVAGRRSVS